MQANFYTNDSLSQLDILRQKQRKNMFFGRYIVLYNYEDWILLYSVILHSLKIASSTCDLCVAA